eukprot:TRINITY_DN3887_c0_g1_i5.p1 TRINITY_DN3887_c0_g1~~TRINITY_DN3887_c0_g1_i5.p1  ORF type:complete len:288 (+),score=68.63 TRINITY_DN3887_c0_g1_i5:735-1598(+)
MSRHAKNNCSSAVFTSYERSKLNYGTQKTRLGKDSIKSWDCCSLCLQPLIEPVSCPKGHLFCKECIYTNLLAQKKEITKKLKEWGEEQDHLREEEQKKKEREKMDEVQRFEKQETSVLPPTSSKDNIITPTQANTTTTKPLSSSSTTTTDETTKVSSYWTLTPSVEPSLSSSSSKKPPSTVTMCSEGNHPLRIKQLIKVSLPKGESKHSCPVCLKQLTNATKVTLLSTCGCIYCQSCASKFSGEGECSACNKSFKEDDLISLQSGGTGFAGHGNKLEASKFTPSARV